MSLAPVYALWEPEIGAARGAMIWWLDASGAHSAVASLLWQLWMWLQESPSWSVAHDDNWKKGKCKCGYRCMSIVTATWKTPVDVWRGVGAWGSEFQEITNWVGPLERTGLSQTWSRECESLRKSLSSGCASSRYSTHSRRGWESIGWYIRMFVVLYNEYLLLNWDNMVQILRVYSIAKLSGFKSDIFLICVSMGKYFPSLCLDFLSGVAITTLPT